VKHLVLTKMESEKFCLRWNDFETNISEAFKEIREEKDFFDVTLACDDNQIQAHKVIISACSPFFRNVLRRNSHQHPLLYLKGVKYKELLSVLDFMYLGEVSIAQEELNSFLSVAEDLRVKGLTQGTKGGEVHRPEPQPPHASKPKLNQTKPILPQPMRAKVLPQARSQTTQEHVQSYRQSVDHEIQEVVPVKSEPHELPPQPQYQPEEHHQDEGHGTVALEESYEEAYDYQYEGTGYQEGEGPVSFTSGKDAREDLINSHIVKDPERKLFTCTLCQFGAPSTHRVFCHLEAKHFQDLPVTYTCPYCGKEASSKNAMCLHISRNHKEEKANSSNLNHGFF